MDPHQHVIGFVLLIPPLQRPGVIETRPVFVHDHAEGKQILHPLKSLFFSHLELNTPWTVDSNREW